MTFPYSNLAYTCIHTCIPHCVLVRTNSPFSSSVSIAFLSLSHLSVCWCVCVCVCASGYVNTESIYGYYLPAAFAYMAGNIIT